MPLEISDTISPFKLVRYVKPSSCTSCQLELGVWRIYRKKLNNRYGNKIIIKFIIDTNNVNGVTELLSIYNLKNDSYVDSIGEFAKTNKGIDDIGSDVVMFLDNQNKILMVGNPCKNHKIRDLIDSTLTQYIINEHLHRN